MLCSVVKHLRVGKNTRLGHMFSPTSSCVLYNRPEYSKGFVICQLKAFSPTADIQTGPVSCKMSFVLLQHSYNMVVSFAGCPNVLVHKRITTVSCRVLYRFL